MLVTRVQLCIGGHSQVIGQGWRSREPREVNSIDLYFYIQSHNNPSLLDINQYLLCVTGSSSRIVIACIEPKRWNHQIKPEPL